MKQAMLKAMACGVVVIGGLGASGASAQAVAPITYMGSLTGSGGGNTLVANFTITTDGTLGGLVQSNITAYSVNFIYNNAVDTADSFTSATPGSFTYFDATRSADSPLLATATSLLFNYSADNYSFNLANGDVNGIGFRGQLARNRNGNNFLQELSNNVSYANRGLALVQPIATAVVASNPVSPVPEPATWGMIILGMGAVGYTMRRKQRIATRIALA